eukprot:12754504-Alexandrium_andersonii.AAC.1
MRLAGHGEGSGGRGGEWDYAAGLAHALGFLLERAVRSAAGIGEEAGGVLAWLAVQSDSLALA